MEIWSVYYYLISNFYNRLNLICLSRQNYDENGGLMAMFGLVALSTV